MNNKIVDLRNHLFSTIEGLLDKEAPLDIERARAVSDVAQTIINSAKVEVDFMKSLDQKGTGSGFIPVEHSPPLPPPAGVSARPALEHEPAPDREARRPAEPATMPTQLCAGHDLKR